MTSYTLYHNPRCSKSREALSLLNQAGIEPEPVLYLQQPPTRETLQQLKQQLGFSDWRQMMRSQETLYRELDLANADQQTLEEALINHPTLLERPILTDGKQARIGRPPQQVLELLQD